ncbi:MAG: hypothetical protein R2932_47010 [Caldilineaceae bacterium]
MTPAQLETGYWRAYRDFYRWSAIWQGARNKENLWGQARHFAYAAGWKSLSPLGFRHPGQTGHAYLARTGKYFGRLWATFRSHT